MKTETNNKAVSKHGQFVLFLCTSAADLTRRWETYGEDTYKILFVSKGTLACEFNGEATMLSHKDIAFIRGVDLCVFDDENDRDAKNKNTEMLECYLMFIATKIFEDTGRLLGAPESFSSFVNADMPLVVTLDTIQCDKIIREMKNFNQPENRRSSDYMNATKLIVAGILYNYIILTKKSEPRFADAPRWFNEYVEQLDDQTVFTRPFAELVELSGKSREHISRLFKRMVGVNISDYIISKRINYACVLLKDDTLSVQEVALMSGFANIGTFYNNFKRRTGESPERYRKTVFVGAESFKRHQRGE